MSDGHTHGWCRECERLAAEARAASEVPPPPLHSPAVPPPPLDVERLKQAAENVGWPWTPHFIGILDPVAREYARLTPAEPPVSQEADRE